MSNVINKDTAAMLKGYVERIENLEDEKLDIGISIRGVYEEAANEGFDKKALRQVVRLRSMDPDTRSNARAMVDHYMSVLGHKD